ncbi:hypothetical protein AB0K23_01445 [Streptomyces sp. NPDC049602]|uniref:hypothetical protein n=1 Tax=Streptomyces sp. NPDC049602 TaxID=3155504 RepID=UPI003449B494
MSSSYRSWEEREADAAKTKAEAALLATQVEAAKQGLGAESAKKKTDELAERVKQAKLGAQLKTVNDDAADKQRERKAQHVEQLANNGVVFKRVVTTIMVLGLAAAVPAQVSYFSGLHKPGELAAGVAWPLLPAPLFLELLAFAGVTGTAWAHRKGMPRWPFWILTAGLASIAGYINLSHGAAEYGTVAGITLAATSIIGPLLAEVRQFLETRAASDPRTLEQRAADKAVAKVRAEAEKAAQQSLADEDEKRKKVYPREFDEYERIIVAHPGGSIDRDSAWEQAWHNLHLLPLGVTAGTLAAREAARAGIAAVLSGAERSPEAITVDLFLADVFGDDNGDGGPTGKLQKRPPEGGTGGGSRAASKGPSKAPTTLVRKGKQASDSTTPKTPGKPLDRGDIDKVRKLAEALGGVDRLSARNVREVIGGGSNEYAVRLRNHIKNDATGSQQ